MVQRRRRLREIPFGGRRPHLGTGAFAYEQQKAESGRSTIFDFNDAKTRMEKAESELVQAKYEFVFRSKILDFYRGKPLKL